MIFDYEDPSTTELDPQFDGCTLYLLTFKHKN